MTTEQRKQKDNSETYRPTVRYDLQYKEYVESIFKTTNLDRNQIMRLALYVMGHTSEGLRILEAFQKDAETPVPLPSWTLFDNWEMWLGRSSNGEKEKGVEDKLNPRPLSKPIKIHSLSYSIITPDTKEVTADGQTKGVQ